MSDKTDSYIEIDRALRLAGAPVSAAESQGVLCGMACRAGSVGEVAWIDELVPGDEEAGAALSGDCHRLLTGMYTRTMATLYDEELTFQLWLPDDDARLADRVAALGEWCQGFLYGLAHAGVGVADDESAVTEVVHDLTEIAQIEIEPNDDSEASEQAYCEIAEFVRVGVLLVLSTQNLPAQQGGLQ